MATFTDLRKKVHSLPERVKKDGSRIIAETDTEYYNDNMVSACEKKRGHIES